MVVYVIKVLRVRAEEERRAQNLDKKLVHDLCCAVEWSDIVREDSDCETRDCAIK